MQHNLPSLRTLLSANNCLGCNMHARSMNFQRLIKSTVSQFSRKHSKHFWVSIISPLHFNVLTGADQKMVLFPPCRKCWLWIEKPKPNFCFCREKLIFFCRKQTLAAKNLVLAKTQFFHEKNSVDGKFLTSPSNQLKVTIFFWIGKMFSFLFSSFSKPESFLLFQEKSQHLTRLAWKFLCKPKQKQYFWLSHQCGK